MFAVIPVHVRRISIAIVVAVGIIVAAILVPILFVSSKKEEDDEEKTASTKEDGPSVLTASPLAPLRVPRAPPQTIPSRPPASFSYIFPLDERNCRRNHMKTAQVENVAYSNACRYVDDRIGEACLFDFTVDGGETRPAMARKTAADAILDRYDRPLPAVCLPDDQTLQLCDSADSRIPDDWNWHSRHILNKPIPCCTHKDVVYDAWYPMEFSPYDATSKGRLTPTRDSTMWAERCSRECTETDLKLRAQVGCDNE